MRLNSDHLSTPTSTCTLKFYQGISIQAVRRYKTSSLVMKRSQNRIYKSAKKQVFPRFFGQYFDEDLPIVEARIAKY